jgi:hypothetical protein
MSPRLGLLDNPVLTSLQEQPPTSVEDQLYLVLAGLLLQSIWFMHHRFESRATSNVYHGMLVMVNPSNRF